MIQKPNTYNNASLIPTIMENLVIAPSSISKEYCWLTYGLCRASSWHLSAHDKGISKEKPSSLSINPRLVKAQAHVLQA